MFTLLPKSQTAQSKACKLSKLHLDLLDMHLTMALLQPHGNLVVLDHMFSVQQEMLFEFLAIETAVAIFVLVFSPRGKMAITDFHLTSALDDELRPRLSV